MRNLCIDVGNTRVKVAIFENNISLIEVNWRKLSARKLEELLDEYQPTQAILSSVRKRYGKIMNLLKERVENVLRLSSKLSLPIVNLYETPETLGNDRIAGVMGAALLFPNTAVLVVDAGTCITYDFMTADKTYHGGSILPGIDMRLEALSTLTARLPHLERADLNDFIGKSTATSIQTGVQVGVLHELKGFIEQYIARFGDLKVVLTGGDATYFESQLKNKIFVQPNLVLVGLNHILNSAS
jgi:type III pantothenate kinase